MLGLCSRIFPAIFPRRFFPPFFETLNGQKRSKKEEKKKKKKVLETNSLPLLDTKFTQSSFIHKERKKERNIYN